MVAPREALDAARATPSATKVPNPSTLARRVDAVCAYWGITTHELKARAGFKNEQGFNENIPARNLAKIADVLGVSTDFLLGRSYLDDGTTPIKFVPTAPAPLTQLPKPTLFARADESDKFVIENARWVLDGIAK